MSSVGKMVSRVRKKDAVKVVHGPFLKTAIRAGMASPAPPLGSQLGQRGINVATFCKDFNKATDAYIPGVPLPTLIQVTADRSHKLDIRTPPNSWLVMHAAGIRRGAATGEKEVYTGKPCGRISLKHVYECARVKATDHIMKGVPMHTVCQMIIGSCHSMGIEVVVKMENVEELTEFLDYRRSKVAADLKALEDQKAAKLLRTA